MPIFPAARAVEVFAPATIANLGAGFDILGMAIEAPYDTIYAERTDEPGIFIDSVTGDGERLPRDPQMNTAGIAAQQVLDLLMIRESGVRLRIHKGLPLESGMGSSAASAAGAAIAVNLGGIVLITGLTPESIYKLPVPENLVLALVTPAVSVATADARAALPDTIPLSTYVQQSAAVALLIAAIYSNDVRHMAQAMESDIIVEPARQHLMPGLYEVREAAREAGALATIISGAGPTLCSICETSNVARLVAEAQALVYASLDIAASTQITTPSRDGATMRVVEQ